jgi:hypothetical protein
MNTTDLALHALIAKGERAENQRYHEALTEIIVIAMDGSLRASEAAWLMECKAREALDMPTNLSSK